MKTKLPLAFLLFFAAAPAAYASSADAWADFAKEVEAGCIAAAADMIEAPKAIVDPFGSESFGLAVVTGKAKGADAQISHICVMNKQTKAIELGSELGSEKLTIGISR